MRNPKKSLPFPVESPVVSQSLPVVSESLLGLRDVFLRVQGHRFAQQIHATVCSALTVKVMKVMQMENYCIVKISKTWCQFVYFFMYCSNSFEKFNDEVRYINDQMLKDGLMIDEINRWMYMYSLD